MTSLAPGSSGKLSAMLNLDTHIVVNAVRNELTAIERRVLRNQKWCISAIVFWELAMLAERNRVNIDLDSDQFRRFISAVEVLPIDLNVARTSTTLDFSSDPADELIAATSIVYGVPLVTRDRRIRNSKMVPLAI